MNQTDHMQIRLLLEQALPSRRERIATAVLTAILSNPSETQAIANSEMGAAESRKGLTALSVRYADALIAAAPELYALLEQCANDLEAEIQHRSSGELPRRIDRDMAIVREARALLAKARGEA